MEIVSNLFGEHTVQISKKQCAGEIAQKEGKKFEDYIGKIIEEILPENYIIKKQPPYTNHYGLSGKRKDFKLIPNTTDLFNITGINHNLKTYMIEAKQLGDCTILEKLDSEWNNLKAGCYGNNFLLVYDYMRYNKSAIRSVNAITNYCKKLKEEVAANGISFEWIDHNNFKRFLIKEFYGNN